MYNEDSWTNPQIASKFNIDELWIVPCGSRPDKPYISEPQKRLDMTNLAVKDFFSKDLPIKVDTVEVENGESIPTRYLLDRYEEEHPDTEFWFVMGTDLIANLHYWDAGDRMVNNTNYCIFSRTGYDLETLMKSDNWPKSSRLAPLGSAENLLGGISSTEVRYRVKHGVGVAGLLTPSVIDYIKKNNLYKN